MKARSLACKTGVPLCLITLGCLIIAQGRGLANGPGDPVTPYAESDSITAEDIENVRTESSRYRVIREIRTEGSEVPVFGERVGFAYVADDGEIGEIAFDLRGTTEGGGDVAVPLSDLKGFTVLEVKVTVFPTISASELLQAEPTYSQLTESYMSKLSMWVFLDGPDKSELSVVGKRWEDDYEVLFAIRDLEPKFPVLLDWVVMDDTPIWWAVESVIEDDKYPHRIAHGD
jgi:hypothetical protein